MLRSILTAVLFAYMLAACTSLQPTATALQPVTGEEFNEAVRQAHESLDVFIRNLQAPQPSQSLFALKVRFNYPDGTSEDVWVDDVHYENGQFYGILYDVQSKNMGFKNGDKVKIPEDIILDWMFLENNVLVGGYTIRLAYDHMTPQQQQTFLKDAQYLLK